MEENARAYAENGHNVAILGKIVQNSLPATTKSKKDASENGHNRASLCKKPQTPSRIVIYIQNSSQPVQTRPR